MSNERAPHTIAAGTVIEALEGLSDEDREKVIKAACALFGITIGPETPSTRPTPPLTGGSFPAQHAPTGKPLSLVELIKQKAPATIPQYLAVFAYYRESVEGVDKFSRADLEPYFVTAKVSKPGNYARDFAKTVQEGWIHEEGANSYLTTAGETAVIAGFGGKRRSAPKKKGKKGVGDE